MRDFRRRHSSLDDLAPQNRFSALTDEHHIR